MMSAKSPLQLKDYRLLKLMVEANDSFISKEDKEVTFEIDCDFDVYKAKIGLSFKIPLSLKVKAKKNRKYCNIKKIEILIEGIFDLSQDAQKELVTRVIPFNCLAILYGIARGIIAAVTGNIQGEQFILPTVNFNEIIKKKAQAQKKEEEKKALS